jgi:tetratricopeptide (TPR) repeat protein
MKNSKFKLLMLFLFVSAISMQAQNITQPRASQQATISQRLGISDVTIVYHSPAVKGRKIWGTTVPYGNIWRAGANENTTIHFSHDAMVEGKAIAAGTYGLYMVPGENEFQLLFSKYHQSWGSNAPAKDDIVLKVSVKPNSIEAQEWLSYDFIDRGSKSLTAALKWDTLSVPFKIEYDVNKIVVDNARAELKGLAGFGQGYNQAAAYCLRNNYNLDEAMTWIDQSIGAGKSFQNLSVKSGLLAKQGKKEASDEIMEEALTIANGNQLNQYGYQLLGKGDTKGAIEIFTTNIEKNPDHIFIWGFTDSLGEAYLADGNKKMALKYYKQAKSKAPEAQYAYLDGVIAGIEAM